MRENLSPRICAPLTAGGHHATHIRDYDMASASDPQVLAKAATEGLTLVTADRGDFGRKLAFTRAVEPSVVLLRQLPDVVRATDVAALLLANRTPAVASALDRRSHAESSTCSAPAVALNRKACAPLATTPPMSNASKGTCKAVEAPGVAPCQRPSDGSADRTVHAGQPVGRVGIEPTT